MSDRLWLLQRLSLLALVGLLATADAQAQSGSRQDDDYAPPPERQNRQPSYRPSADSDRAANAARKATGGRVLGIQDADQNGQRGYRVRILEPSGRVRSLHFDPDSGAVRD